MPGVVTLLTDFGLADSYVGQVKGSILTAAPDARIVDLSHAIAPQDVAGGAFVLWSAVEAFPRGTVHVAVVDPGVGTSRRGLAIRSKSGDMFVGPDNGLLVPGVELRGGVELAVSLRAGRFWREKVASTFHGRDVFGPVAGHLANGLELIQLGPEVNDLDRSASWAEPVVESRGIRGTVIHADRYGNLVTSLPSAKLQPSFVVEIAGRRIAGLAATYQQVGMGELMAVAGSSGLLEVCVRDGSAAEVLGVARGEAVLVRTA